MAYRNTRTRPGFGLAFLITLVSLPMLISLVELGADVPRGLPSPLGLSLLFLHLLTLPAIAWVFAYRQQRDAESQSEVHLARFGTSRIEFVARTLLRKTALLAVLGYGISTLLIGFYYGRPQADLYWELLLVAPVVLVWSFFLVLFFQAVRSWTHKLGLWMALLFYPMALALALPIGPSGHLGGMWTSQTVRLSVSPLFHVAHLLGALVQRHPFPAWMSLAILGVYSALLMGLLLVRVPR